MKANAMSVIESNNNMPLFDLPVDFIVYDDIKADLLQYYANFPCKLEACIFAYVVEGCADASINLWDYTMQKNDFIVIMPGTFFQVKKVSDDIKVAFVGFSSASIKAVNLWQNLSPVIMQILSRPIFRLEPDFGNIIFKTFSLITEASNLNANLVTTHLAESFLNLIIGTLVQAIKNDLATCYKPVNTREQQILSEFLHLALENYRIEHKVSFYAQKANLTLSHFCNVINKATGMTPQEMIMNMIIKDAKTQLKASKEPIANIAASLGFPTPTTFTRYFRTYTGTTPQAYRNSK